MDTGLGFVQPLFFVGVVENRNDPRAEGRIQVRAFGIHGSNRDIATDDLPWATLIIGSHDVNFTPPPLNAWVFGFFIDGRDAQQPMILGLIPTQATDIVRPDVYGWGSVPVEDYDAQSQGTRPRDLGLSPMSKLATGEFLNETYNEALEVNRVKGIPIAGGCARGHSSIGNGNAWGNDVGEGTVGSPVIPRSLGATEQARVDALDNDTAFQTELARFIKKHGVTREQVYGIIAGESSYSSSVVNRFGYAGFFQLGTAALTDINKRNGTRHTPISISRMPPGEQLRVYDQYLDRWNFKNSSGLGIMQAAPAFASRSGNTEVYAIDSREWKANPVWRGPDKRITVDSINAYYSRRNPPQKNQTVDPGLQRAVDQQRSEIQTIRQQIRDIDAKIANLKLPEDAAELNDLKKERTSLEEKLKRADPSGSTEAGPANPYGGYMQPAAYNDCATSWEEPASAYAAQYPYNRVIETASGHSIELDDSPGAERIMIWHKNGSYIQIAPTSTTHKNISDAYDINERNYHVYVGGNNLVTIEGDCHVLVKGNKIEEIQGDYKQIVHGNISMGSAGRVEINGADRTDIRSAALGLDSNVENLNIRTSKNIVFQSGETISLNSKNIRIGASENMSVSGKDLFLQSIGGDLHAKASGNLYMNPDQNLFLRTEGGSISMQSEGSFRLNSNSFIAMKSTGYTSISADANIMIGSDATINMNADGIMGIKSNGMFLNSSGGDLNIKAGGNINAGSTQINLSASTAHIESAGVLDIKGQHVKVGGGSKVSLDASVVAIDDIVQLAGGQAAAPAGIQSPIQEKEPLNPSSFGLGQGESGGELAEQAKPAEPPSEASSEASDGMSEPPIRSTTRPRPKPENSNVSSPPSSTFLA